MIVPMKRVTLLCVRNDTDGCLKALRDLGCMQLDASDVPSAATVSAKAGIEDAALALRLLAKAKGSVVSSSSEIALPESVADVLSLQAKKDSALAKVEALSRIEKVYAPFGDFDPSLAAELAKKGLVATLVKYTELPELPSGAYVRKLGDNGKTSYGVIVSSAAVPSSKTMEVVPMPASRLASLRADIASARDEVSAVDSAFAASGVLAAKIASSAPELADTLAFESARDALSSKGSVSWVCGWVPVDVADDLVAAAKAKGWGVALRDPEASENPPVLIRPPKLFAPVTSLFKGLGVAPAYNESDVSVPFMCYFSVFFAMLVGDGGYGAIILALTLWGWKKFASVAAARSWLVLLTVFSSATILWGVASNTWFGASPACLANPVSEWLGDPTYMNMMFLCFTIGVSHLMLARIWNGVCMLNSLTCLGQFGWAGIVLFMYFVTNSIVGISSGIPAFAYWVFGVSVAAVFLFSVPFSELKTRGAELGMLPLNIMSALGDIISYVRLFAVGLASVKVAQNFNDMAIGLLDSGNALWLNALLFVGTLAILLVGHALNFAMAGLSVLVHAVRLNTLEFSNHKGVSWSGITFSPFRGRGSVK